LPGAAAAVDAIVARHGRLDCLVNNAAVRDRRGLSDITAGDFRRVLETNLVAQYDLSRVAARHMTARGQGRLVFVSSMVGAQSFQGDPAYVASKGGLEALVRALAVELGPSRFGRPDDLVGAAIFLASDAASYITDQVLTVDAGLSVAL
jgi:gluconate 5-dehydrogenase